jgi:hypothetical protein
VSSGVRITYACFACGRVFEMGPQTYDGTFIPRYDIRVCRTCYVENWDGWGPFIERRLLAHLKESGIAVPPRNANGWLPRD